MGLEIETHTEQEDKESRMNESQAGGLGRGKKGTGLARLLQSGQQKSQEASSMQRILYSYIRILYSYIRIPFQSESKKRENVFSPTGIIQSVKLVTSG